MNPHGTAVDRRVWMGLVVAADAGLDPLVEGRGGADAIDLRAVLERGVCVCVEPGGPFDQAPRLGHVAGATTVGFARGLNDTPKFLG